MKSANLCIILLSLVININCGNASSTNKVTPENSFAEINFKTTSAELGKIPAKVNATYDFVFSNSGNSPLTITEVRGNCHCVQGKFTDKPINPGDSSAINVSFDPTGVTGLFIRTLMVRSNAKTDSVELKISGEILPGK
jgi:hypothetical protein